MATAADILKDCEKNGTAPAYVFDENSEHNVVEMPLADAAGREVVVVSDLHLAAGLDANWRYVGTENFFTDDAFARFIDHLLAEPSKTGRVLVINGDVIDYIRIVQLPTTDAAFEAWSDKLAEIGVEMSTETLRTSIIPKEKKYGLRTHNYKSVWRLWRVIDGHPALFDALARWLGDERNRLVIVKGNHDLEWFWKMVRDGLRMELARKIARVEGIDLVDVLRDRVVPHITFVDDAIAIDRVYIEHGHRHDRLTKVVGKPSDTYGDARGEQQLNIPFGSFFNRYLINRIEASYPFIDNVRPQESILPLLIRERFPLAIRLLFAHVPMTVKMIGKPYWGFVLGRTLLFLLMIVVAVGPFAWLFGSTILPMLTEPQNSSDSGIIGGVLTSIASGLGGLVLSWLLSRLVAYLQLTEPSSLEEFARPILEETEVVDGEVRQRYDVVTMGHTHNPDQMRIGSGWFFNTGTWIPVVSRSSAELREDGTFCVLRIERDGEGRPAPLPLGRWNDAAGRIDRMAIVHRK